jgi:MacB-like protein
VRKHGSSVSRTHLPTNQASLAIGAIASSSAGGHAAGGARAVPHRGRWRRNGHRKPGARPPEESVRGAAGVDVTRAADRRRPLRSHARQSAKGRPRFQNRERCHVHGEPRRTLRAEPEAADISTLMESLATVPGVRAVGANTTRLFTGGRWDSQITLQGRPAPADGSVPWSFFNAVTPGYFEALGIPVTLGRDFTWNDWGASRQVALVNQALAIEYFKGTQPVGQQLGQGRNVPVDTEIIGVFGDAHYHDVRGEIPRQTFVNMDAKIDLVNALNVYARILGDPRAIMPLLRTQVSRVDAEFVVSDMRMMDPGQSAPGQRTSAVGPVGRIRRPRHDPGGRRPAWRACVHRGPADA